MKTPEVLSDRPKCYNRTVRVGYWVRAGYRSNKIVLRFIPYRFSQTCMSWITSGDVKPDPVLNGWNCHGCVWKPVGVAV